MCPAGQAVDPRGLDVDLLEQRACVQNSAMPMPMALPCVASVRPRTTIRLTLGHSSSTASWSLNLRPTTLVSMPVPLMFLPISSIDQHVDLLERQPRHPLLGQHEQFLLAGLELARARRPRSAAVSS